MRCPSLWELGDIGGRSTVGGFLQLLAQASWTAGELEQGPRSALFFTQPHLIIAPLGSQAELRALALMRAVLALGLCLASASASFLAPLPAQTRQPRNAVRAVRMQAPATTETPPAKKSFVQTEMRSE